MFVDSLTESTKAMLATTKKKSKSTAGDASSTSQPTEIVEIILSFKRFIYDSKKAMRQT